jgi:myo-inositol 2-dehydrogenase/D-chiro-inositol 1-dehydrogenase
LTIGEGKVIRKFVEDTGKILQVGTQQRSEYPSKYPNSDKVLHESFLAAVAIAQSGRLGDTLRAEYHIDPVTFSMFPEPIEAEKPPQGFNWDFWLGQAPVTEFCQARSSGHFRYWFEYAGGEVTDGGVHHMDIALWALGGDKTGVIEADATGEFQFDREQIRDAVMGKKDFSELPRRFNTEVTSRCDYRLSNSQNVLAFKTAPGDFSIYIQGEKGRIRVNRVSGLRGKPIEDIVASDTDWKWLQDAIDKFYRGMPRENHMANFFDCVKTREKPVSDVWTHVNSANACHMASVSMLLGRKVQFDPDKYQFIGDDDANLFINRKQRKPWTVTA